MATEQPYDASGDATATVILSAIQRLAWPQRESTGLIARWTGHRSLGSVLCGNILQCFAKAQGTLWWKFPHMSIFTQRFHHWRLQINYYRPLISWLMAHTIVGWWGKQLPLTHIQPLSQGQVSQVEDGVMDQSVTSRITTACCLELCVFRGQQKGRASG